MNYEFIVSNKSGLPLYAYNTEKNAKVDPALLSGFLSAIISVSECNLGAGIKNIEMGTKSITIYKNEDKQLYYTLINNDKNNKSINKKLEGIVKSFEKQYEPILTKWNGNLEIFSGFDEYFKKLK
jgi:hypothetical protein